MIAVQDVAGEQIHICAWCGCTMQNGFPVEFAGDISSLDSHGICHGCTKKYFGVVLASAGVEEAEVRFSLTVEGVTCE